MGRSARRRPTRGIVASEPPIAAWDIVVSTYHRFTTNHETCPDEEQLRTLPLLLSLTLGSLSESNGVDGIENITKPFPLHRKV